jgi:hypothetical protein
LQWEARVSSSSRSRWFQRQRGGAGEFGLGFLITPHSEQQIAARFRTTNDNARNRRRARRFRA